MPEGGGFVWKWGWGVGWAVGNRRHLGGLATGTVTPRLGESAGRLETAATLGGNLREGGACRGWGGLVSRGGGEAV